MGWPTGIEPAAPGATVLCSTTELRPPSFDRHESDESIGSPATARLPLLDSGEKFHRARREGANESGGQKARGLVPRSPWAASFAS